MSNETSLYVARESGLHRLHPLTKLVLAFFCLVLGVVMPGAWLSYLIFAVLVVPLAAWGQISRRLVNITVRAVLPFAISLFLVQGFFWPGGTPILSLGPLSLKEEGLAFAIRSSGRILILVSSFLLLSLSTRPDALMMTLSQHGVPKSIAYIMLTTLQIIPRFQDKANTILDAQRSRGLETEGSLRRRIRALLPLIQPLILGSIVDIEERAVALEARAFGRPGAKTSLLVLDDTRAQQVGRWLLALGAVAAVAGRVALA